MPYNLDRRSFLQLPLAAAALALTARAADENKSAPSSRDAKGFRVGAKQNRAMEELMIMGGSFDCKVSGRDSGGDLLIYDTLRHEKGGPAFHRRHFQDEWFYVIRGEFIVRVGDDTLTLRPGDSAFAPRKTPHAFAKISEGEAPRPSFGEPRASLGERDSGPMRRPSSSLAFE